MSNGYPHIQAGETTDIHCRDMTVGTLRRRSEALADIEFSYAPDWLAYRDRFPVSMRIPLGNWVHGPTEVYPWFLNLLPEGSSLERVGSILQVNDSDVIGLLGQMGGDLQGALEIGPWANTASPRYLRQSESGVADIIGRLADRPLLAGEDGIHLSLAGAQDKLAVALDAAGNIHLPLDGAPSTHILKPANKRYHASVPNEAFCMRLAKAAGLPAARVLVGTAEGIEYLLVERYDRKRTPSGIQRIHQEDFCQASGTPPYLKYEWNKELSSPGLSLIKCMDVMDDTGVPANKLRFLDGMLFNVLAGNVDAHAKNYSLVFDGRVPTLAPLYDVMNGDIYQGVTRNLAMKIAGKQRGDHIHGRHWDKVAESSGLSSGLVRKRVERISRAVLEAVPLVVDEMNATLPSLMYAEIGSYVERHCRSMLANLDTVPRIDDDEGDDVSSVFDGLAGEESGPIVISP